jgi:hypothetical protein
MSSKIFSHIIISTLITLSTVFNPSRAQELKAKVTVVPEPGSQVTTVDKEVFADLKIAIEDFLNNTKWTNDVFEPHERINCSFQLTLRTPATNGVYRGSLIVNASRPIFNASISTTLINFKDDFIDFSFNRDQIMQYTENQFRDNLTSIFAFWAYMILGYDYDSFSLEGGTKYFNLAQQIVTLAQTTLSSGWSQNESSKRNRFYIIDNHINALYKPLREAYYIYHRQGLDLMFSDFEKARKNIIAALKALEPLQTARFGSVNLQIFTLAKREEFVNIFSKAETGEKTEVIAILKKLDPTNGENYDNILKM